MSSTEVLDELFTSESKLFVMYHMKFFGVINYSVSVNSLH